LTANASRLSPNVDLERLAGMFSLSSDSIRLLFDGWSHKLQP
jgi:hypothetical protein